MWQNKNSGGHEKQLFHMFTLFIPGDFIMDILLLFLLILTMNMRICHITIKFSGYPAAGHRKHVMT
jgi:hypothetical protein